MSLEKFTAKLQNITKTSKAELTVAFIIVFGLSIGLAIQVFFSEEKDFYSENEQVYNFLDSIAEAEATTYIGTDMENNVHKELAKADTVVEKKSLFPQHNTKKKPIQKDEKININTASKVELMSLSGVGEKTAQKIITYRKNTPFNSIEDIQNVKGIGPKKFEKMKQFIEVK
jgi:comEA protein